jgi:hypothetical protein
LPKASSRLVPARRARTPTFRCCPGSCLPKSVLGIGSGIGIGIDALAPGFGPNRVLDTDSDTDSDPEFIWAQGERGHPSPAANRRRRNCPQPADFSSGQPSTKPGKLQSGWNDPSG